jgi:CubicO group peptidase (beta-lactamase class C family)
MSDSGAMRARMKQGVSRRRVLGTLAATGLATSVAGLAVAARPAAARGQAATPQATGQLAGKLLHDFVDDIEAAMTTFGIPGAAIALVHGAEIVFNRGFGVRDLERGEPVTTRTRFRIGSITKSMTALLLATLVDEGVLAWDDRAVDLWSDFRAPTDELTRTLRLRDLLGMASGIAESNTVSVPVVEFLMIAALLSAVDVLRSIDNLPVIAPPDTTFAYNNTLFSAAAYIGLLAEGTPPQDLEAAYAAEMRRRVFESIGMADAAIADDPRPLGDDYAVGYDSDLFANPSRSPFVSIAGIAPAGSGLASATDMARYLITQMSGGATPEGVRVVSAANLAETHRPGILIEPGELAPPEFQADTASLHYDMGWLTETFRDGRRLVWHNGAIDGFNSAMGFLPDERIGFVFLNNLDRGGALFNLSLQASLLSRLYGLNAAIPGFLSEAIPIFAARSAALAEQTSPVDPAAVMPFLGVYEDGFRVRLDDEGGLRLDHDIRSLPLLALPDETYVVAAGPDVILEQPVVFALDAAGMPVMTISGFEPVRWLTGG